MVSKPDYAEILGNQISSKALPFCNVVGPYSRQLLHSFKEMAFNTEVLAGPSVRSWQDEVDSCNVAFVKEKNAARSLEYVLGMASDP